MPQCQGICKGSGTRCKKLARKGELTCSLKNHLCSVSYEVYNATELPEELTNIIGQLAPYYPTTAYLIGGIGYETGKPLPLPIDSITMGTHSSTDVSLSYHSEQNNKDQWRGSLARLCGINRLIYVFGGNNDTDTSEVYSRKVDTYDPLSDTWDTTTIPMIPGGDFNFYPVVVGSNIYGINGIYNKAESMYRLDTESLTWSEIQVTMPDNLKPSTICSIDNVIYVFGTSLSNLGVYGYTFDTDAINPRWEILEKKIASMSSTPYGTVVIKNKIYLFGAGYIWVFDAESKNCTKLSRVAYKLSLHPFLLDDERYIFFVASERQKIVAYDIENETWLDDLVHLPPMNNSRHFSVVTLPGSSRD
jgi:hypothetical protein